ncbi:MerC family mercury resistance protein [Pseudidiomarina mangrovi]|uniref:MerC family mercury resistance protein n=1 Tax=Pseudidiomarina mangrovi TaxID=2487133 RepID=UPI000FCC3D28|nr:MerC family mercury resistance protein [Pseudidiomarina mangrovi]
MKESLLSFGGIGSGVAAVAAATPCCFPVLASVASIVGLSALLPYSEYIAYIVQIFGLLAVVGAYLSFRKHGKHGPLALTVLCFSALLVVYNIFLLGWLLYSALVGLVVAAIWNTLEAKRCNQCITQA